MVSHTCSGPQKKPGPTKGGTLAPFRGYTHMGPPRGGLTRLPGAIIYTGGRREEVSHPCPGLIYTRGRREEVSHTCPGLLYTRGRREEVSHTCPGLLYTRGRREEVSHTCPGLLYSTRSIYTRVHVHTQKGYNHDGNPEQKGGESNLRPTHQTHTRPELRGQWIDPSSPEITHTSTNTEDQRSACIRPLLPCIREWWGARLTHMHSHTHNIQYLTDPDPSTKAPDDHQRFLDVKFQQWHTCSIRTDTSHDNISTQEAWIFQNSPLNQNGCVFTTRSF